MKLIADVCVIPMLEGESIASEVAFCQQVLAERGLEHRMHAFGTNIEGEWDEVMAAVKAFHVGLHKRGIARISSNVRLATRSDKETSIVTKIERVKSLLQ